MSETIDAAGRIEALERECAKLRRINDVLMHRVESKTSDERSGYAHFETALLLDRKVRARTRDLEEAMDLLQVTNARLAAARRETERADADVAAAMEAFEGGFALFDAEDRLIRMNSRFAGFVPDLAKRMKAGMAFKDYVRIVGEAGDLVLPPGHDVDSWCDARMAAHRRRSVNFNAQVVGDRWIQVSEHRTPSGGTALLQTDVTDIIRTEREEREKLLDRQARLVRATLDHVDRGLIIVDPAGRVVAANIPFRELMALPARALRLGTRIDRLVELLERFGLEDGAALLDWMSEDGRREPLTLKIARRDERTLSLTAIAMADGSVVLTVVDITAQKSAEVALAEMRASLEARTAERMQALKAARDSAEKANAAKTRFVAAASHDLLQPLSAARLFAASLADHELPATEQALADRIHRALGSVEELLGGLLDISRLDAPDLTPSLAEVPIGRLFESIATDFDEVARRKGIELRVVPSSAVVVSDPALLRRVLQNLVSNAIRYTARGRVLLGVRRCGDVVRVVVGDTGCGIDEADQKAVFEEFRRLDNNKGEIPGMGLGLAIVDRACRILNHDLALDSVPGRGTVFSLSLPVMDYRTREADKTQAPAEAVRLDDVIVLLVEDDDAVREGMVRLLEGWGASPMAAASADEARTMLNDLGLMPDAVIADHHLGAGDTGLDLVREMRAAGGTFLGVLTTFDRDPALREAAVESSLFVRYKPVDPDAIADLLMQVRPGASAALT
ncbi:MAG: PAS-domain containing protein [Pseudomonadota bacterium]